MLTRVKGIYQWSVNLTDAGDFGEIPPDMKPIGVSKSEIWSEGAKGGLLSTTHPGEKKDVQAQMLTKNIALPTSENRSSREWYIDDEVER